jgi:hypothetical protein
MLVGGGVVGSGSVSFVMGNWNESEGSFCCREWGCWWLRGSWGDWKEAVLCWSINCLQSLKLSAASNLWSIECVWRYESSDTSKHVFSASK